MRRAQKVLRFELRECMFCRSRTPHDVVKTGRRAWKWFGPPSRDVRVVNACRRCGGYRLIGGTRTTPGVRSPEGSEDLIP